MIVTPYATRPSLIRGASPGAGLPPMSAITLRDIVVAFGCARCDATHTSRVTLSSAYGDHEERAAWDALADALCDGWALTHDEEPMCGGCRTGEDIGVTTAQTTPASEAAREDGGELTGSETAAYRDSRVASGAGEHGGVL